MDPWHVLTIAALVGLSLSVSRQFKPRGDFGQGARLERKLDLILKHFGLGTELSVEIPARVHELAQAGQKVQAIRELRQSNPWLSLKEAKDYVEGRH